MQNQFYCWVKGFQARGGGNGQALTQRETYTLLTMYSEWHRMQENQGGPLGKSDRVSYRERQVSLQDIFLKLFQISLTTNLLQTLIVL